MGTLGCREVKALLFPVSSIARSFLGVAAAQPHQAARQDAADLTQVRREVGIDGVRWHGWEARSCLPTKKNRENNLLAKYCENKSTAA